MYLQERIEILDKLGKYLTNQQSVNENNSWSEAVQNAYLKNPWFTPFNINQAAASIATHFLNPDLLSKWAESYAIQEIQSPKKIGIIMAGNIPMVGFHDLLCVFISGHHALCKLSSKDDVLIRHIVEKMSEWNPEIRSYISFEERLNNCDAYIATGSNNSARYFSYYFGKYPSIIRKNRTSVAVLTGEENTKELEALADDIMMYFGLGCRNVTQIMVPENYDFIPLLHALKKYNHYFDHHKYKNNFDYQLAIYLMNNMYYMTNDSIVLIENQQPFSPIGTLHYSYYKDADSVSHQLKQNPEIQVVVGKQGIPFGKTQEPSLTDYADGVDVMEFLKNL
jgi:hypothetical protein